MPELEGWVAGQNDRKSEGTIELGLAAARSIDRQLPILVGAPIYHGRWKGKWWPSRSYG